MGVRLGIEWNEHYEWEDYQFERDREGPPPYSLLGDDSIDFLEELDLFKKDFGKTLKGLVLKIEFRNYLRQTMDGTGLHYGDNAVCYGADWLTETDDDPRWCVVVFKDKEPTLKQAQKEALTERYSAIVLMIDPRLQDDEGWIHQIGHKCRVCVEDPPPFQVFDRFRDCDGDPKLMVGLNGFGKGMTMFYKPTLSLWEK